MTEPCTLDIPEKQIVVRFPAATFEYEGAQDLKVGQVVDVNKFNASSGDKEEKISGKYIIGKIYRQFVSERDMMSTRVTLYRDNLA